MSWSAISRIAGAAPTASRTRWSRCSVDRRRRGREAPRGRPEHRFGGHAARDAPSATARAAPAPGAARGLHAQDYRLAVDIDKADPQIRKAIGSTRAGISTPFPRGSHGAGRSEHGSGRAGGSNSTRSRRSTTPCAQDAVELRSGSLVGALVHLADTLRQLTLFGAPEALPRSASGVNVAPRLVSMSRGERRLPQSGSGSSARTRARAAGQRTAAPDDPADEARRLAGRLDLRLDASRSTPRARSSARAFRCSRSSLSRRSTRRDRGAPRRPHRGRSARARSLAAVAGARAAADGRSRARQRGGAVDDRRRAASRACAIAAARRAIRGSARRWTARPRTAKS